MCTRDRNLVLDHIKSNPSDNVRGESYRHGNYSMTYSIKKTENIRENRVKLISYIFLYYISIYFIKTTHILIVCRKMFNPYLFFSFL